MLHAVKQKLSENQRIVAGQTAVQVVGKAVTAIGTVIMLRLITSEDGLGLEGYAPYAVITGFVAYFWVLTDFGFNAIFVQRATDDPDSSQKEFGRLFTLRLLLSLVLMFVAVALLAFLPSETYTTTVKLGIIAAISSVLFYSLFTTGNAVFQLRLKYQYSVAISVVSSLVGVLLAYLALQFGFGVPGLVLAFVVKYLVLGLGAVWLVRSELRWRIDFDWQGMKRLVLDAAPLGISVIFTILYFRSDMFMLGVLPLDPALGYTGKQAVGLYTPPYQVFEVFLTLPIFMMNAVYPLMLRAYTQSLNSLLGLTRRTLMAAGAIGAVSLVATWFLSGWVIGIMTKGNPEFAPSVQVLQLLSLSMPLFFLTGVVVFTLMTLQRRRWLPVVYFVAGLVNIGLNLLLIPKYGITAAALTTGITELVVLIGLSVLLVRAIRQLRGLPLELQPAASVAE